MDNDIATCQEILQRCRELVEAGLIARTWGNISARADEEHFLITPSGKAYEDLMPEDLALVSLKDLSWEGPYKPSSEKNMHAEIYRLRPDCNFIVHTHQSNASAVSIAGEDLVLDEFPAVTSEQKMILGGVIPCASYGLSSTRKLARNVARAFRDNPGSPAVLMRYHGAVCTGTGSEEAFRAAYTLEDVCGRVFEKKCGEPVRKTHWDETSLLSGKPMRNGWKIHLKTPYVMEMSLRGKMLPSYLDDMAQISGIVTECVSGDPKVREIQKALKGRSAFLIHGKGAVCAAGSREEAEACAMVFEKNCQAATYGLKKAIRPVDTLSGWIERIVYIKKYSKLKDR